MHTLWANGGCSAQALNYVAVPQQQSCKNNQGARGQKVLETAKNGVFCTFLPTVGASEPGGARALCPFAPNGLVVCQGACCNANGWWGGSLGAAKMAGPGPKTAQNGPQMAVFAPKQPPMAGACGQMASFVLFVLGGHAKAPFVAIWAQDTSAGPPGGS